MGMMKSLRDSLKNGLLSPFNVGRWIGGDNIKHSSRTVKNIYAGLRDDQKSVQGEKTKKTETFEQAIERFGITEADLKKRMLACKKRILVYLMFALLTLVYMMYLFSTDFLRAAFLCLIILLVLLAYSFKEHFEYSQMKHRKLKYSIKQWLKDLF